MKLSESTVRYGFIRIIMAIVSIIREIPIMSFVVKNGWNDILSFDREILIGLEDPVE